MYHHKSNHHNDHHVMTHQTTHPMVQLYPIIGPGPQLVYADPGFLDLTGHMGFLCCSQPIAYDIVLVQ